ncbi:MAG: O-methyltransferase [Actinomycetota bacterium]|nr:O-methyltransferase [Actinomycetota bacterium]
MNFIDDDVAEYLRRLCDRFDRPLLVEMEQLAAEQKFPIVGRVVGALLEMLTRSIKARRVFELGSGFGFSAYWFARGVGSGGEVVLTDTDAANTEKAKDFLTRAGLASRCQFVTGDALGSLLTSDGQYDIVYCDIDKTGYPAAFEVAAERIKQGGYFLCDNVLWSGRVAKEDDDDNTRAIRALNEAVYADPRYLPSIIPIRDGVLAALRVK